MSRGVPPSAPTSLTSTPVPVAMRGGSWLSLWAGACAPRSGRSSARSRTPCSSTCSSASTASRWTPPCARSQA
eukprot:1101676-Alexandrium_andersonii.AAC.1